MDDRDKGWQIALSPGTPLSDGAGETGVYVIRRWIGAGGMGAVCEVDVTDRADGPHVAKFLLDDRHAPQFFHEAAWQSQGLPGVVPVLWSDFTVIPRLGRPVPLLIMPYYSNGNLYQLQHLGGYTVRAAVTWILEIASALRDLPVVHRDIKPENILFNQDWQAELTDFGIAMPLDKELRQAYGLANYGFMGTGPYMAPEQSLSGDTLDGRTDVYALGLVLYETITRKPAYTDVFAAEDCQMQKLVSPNQFEDVQDQALRSIMLGCTHTAMSKRYTPAALLDALREYLNNAGPAADVRV